MRDSPFGSRLNRGHRRTPVRAAAPEANSAPRRWLRWRSCPSRTRRSDRMRARARTSREHGNAYNICVLVLTLMSLAIMALQLLPVDTATLDLLRVYDNAICVIFLGDFLYNLAGSRPKTTYFIYQRGWLDLLGSLPTLGVFQLTALFRLARLSRLARIGKLLSGQNRTALVRDVVDNRGQYATFITLLSAALVLIVASIIVLEAE